MTFDRPVLEETVHAIERDEIDAQGPEQVLQLDLYAIENPEIHRRPREEHPDVEVRALGANGLPGKKPEAVIRPRAEQIHR